MPSVRPLQFLQIGLEVVELDGTQVVGQRRMERTNAANLVEECEIYAQVYALMRGG